MFSPFENLFESFGKFHEIFSNIIRSDVEKDFVVLPFFLFDDRWSVPNKGGRVPIQSFTFHTMTGQDILEIIIRNNNLVKKFHILDDVWMYVRSFKHSEQLFFSIWKLIYPLRP